MIGLFLVCVLQTKLPCPPPPPPSTTEQIVGLPAKEVELVDEESEKEIVSLKAKRSVQRAVKKPTRADLKYNSYNRRGTRNH